MPVATISDDRPPQADEFVIWRLATAMSAATTPLEVATALAEQGAAAAGAALSNMAILDRKQSRVHVVHGSTLAPAVAAKWTEFDLDERTPLCAAIQTGLPVLLGSLSAIGEQYPNLVEDTVAASLVATASLALRIKGDDCLGAAGFAWADPQAFDTAQVQRLDLIAQLAAQALDRALLYERERQEESARELAVALLLQEAFLPSTLPAIRRLEIAVAYLPASDAAVGGDWYDAFAVDGGTCLVIGDVSGHGFDAAGAMGQLRYAARAFAYEDSSPASVMNRLNQLVHRSDVDEIASVIIALWEPATRTLRRCNAGHPPALRAGLEEVAYLTPDRGPVLGAAQDWQYHEDVLTLDAGTVLLFYTDGLIETRDDTIDSTMAELKALVADLPVQSLQALCEEVVAWRLQMGPREDDICLLAIRAE